MTKDLPFPKLPKELAARIHKIALKTGSSDEEVVARLMRTFFEMVDDSDKKDVPAFVARVRKALVEKSEAG